VLDGPGRVSHAIIEDKSGRRAIAASVFVDASGDADLASRAQFACYKQPHLQPPTACVLLQGLPPGDARGERPAISALRQLGDLAAESGVRISIYHHKGDWTESLLHALRVVAKTNHRHVGANFNLCHWLMVDGEKDYRPVLRANADKIANARTRTSASSLAAARSSTPRRKALKAAPRRLPPGPRSNTAMRVIESTTAARLPSIQVPRST